MSKPKFDELATSLMDMAAAKQIGKQEQLKHFQAAAADATEDPLGQVGFDGCIGDAYVLVGTACGAGESMTVDLLKNGVSVLTAVLTIDATTDTLNQIPLPIDPALASFLAGDVFTTTRDYTAGGTPTPMANTTVVVEPSLKSYYR